jgi:hypothetical protein
MAIDVSGIILLVAIGVASLIVLYKVFYQREDNEDMENEQKTLRDFPAVAKIWEEPMIDNHKEILAGNHDDLINEIAANSDSDDERDNTGYRINDDPNKFNYTDYKLNNAIDNIDDTDDLINDDSNIYSADDLINDTSNTYNTDDIIDDTSNTYNTDHLINHSSIDSDEEFLVEKDDDFEITIAKNLHESKNLSESLEPGTNNKKKDKAKIRRNIIRDVAVGDNIIFSYNNEKYSSDVLEIKHHNVKVKYRSQEKWIKFSDIEKIF